MQNQPTVSRVDQARCRKLAIGVGLLLLLLLGAIVAKPQLVMSSTWGQWTLTQTERGLQTHYKFERSTPEPAVLEESARSMERFRQRQAEHPALPDPGYQSPIK